MIERFFYWFGKLITKIAYKILPYPAWIVYRSFWEGFYKGWHYDNGDIK